MEKNTAIEVLRIQLNKLEDFRPGGKIFSTDYLSDLDYVPSKNNGIILRKKYCEFPLFASWEIGTISILNNIFGPTNDLVIKFKGIEYDKRIVPNDNLKEADFAKSFLLGIDKAEKFLNHFIQELLN